MRHVAGGGRREQGARRKEQGGRLPILEYEVGWSLMQVVGEDTEGGLWSSMFPVAGQDRVRVRVRYVLHLENSGCEAGKV